MMMEDFFMLSRQVSLAVVSKFQQYQLQSGFAAKWRTSSPPKSSSIGYFARFAKEKEQKKVISIYLQMFCIPQVENGTQRRAEKESRRSGADGAGASSVAVRQSPSDPNQKLRSLSSSLGRYHELRRDRGRWVGYVREAGGINGANLQERCRGSKRGQPPRGAERASRHGPETAQTLLAQWTSGNDPSFLLLSKLWRTWCASGLLGN